MAAYKYFSLIYILGGILCSLSKRQKFSRHLSNSLDSIIIQKQYQFSHSVRIINSRYLSMSSKLQNLLIKYEKDVNEQKNLKMNQGVAGASNAKRCELIASHAMSLIAILCLDETKINTVSQKKIEDIAKRLLDQKSKRHRVNMEKLKKTIGLFFMDFFEENPDLESIKSEFQIIYEEEDDIEPEQSQMGDEEDFRTMLSDMNFMHRSGEAESTECSANNLSYFSLHEENRSSGFKKENKAAKQTQWGKNPFEMRVIKYLSQLTAPQTQLGYLCQSMGWSWNFTDAVGESCTEFTTTATVNFQYKNVKKELVQSYKVNNKKKGRMITSFLLLRKIYFSCPAIWDLFEGIKKQKSLYVPRDQNNSILKQDVLIEGHDEKFQEPIVENKHQFEADKAEYLRDISKYKAQINLIAQQNPNIFSFVKLDKMQDVNGRWSVKGTMTCKIGDKTTELKQIFTHSNSKNAQENVAKALSLKIFDTYPQILQKMIVIKKKKGIKT